MTKYPLGGLGLRVRYYYYRHQVFMRLLTTTLPRWRVDLVTMLLFRSFVRRDRSFLVLTYRYYVRILENLVRLLWWYYRKHLRLERRLKRIRRIEFVGSFYSVIIWFIFNFFLWFLLYVHWLWTCTTESENERYRYPFFINNARRAAVRLSDIVYKVITVDAWVVYERWYIVGERRREEFVVKNWFYLYFVRGNVELS